MSKNNEQEIKNLSIGELENMFFDNKTYDELSEEEKQKLEEENKELESLEEE